MRWTSKFATGLVALAMFAGCEVRSTKIIGKDEGRIRTEDFTGVWVASDSGRTTDTLVFSGLTTRPAVLLSRTCAGEDSVVIELATGRGLKFFNTIELHPRKEEFDWATFDRIGDTIVLHIPGSEFFAEAVKKRLLRGKVDSGGSVLMTDRSENVVSFLRRNRGAPGLFEDKLGMRLVKLPAGCAIRSD